MSDDNTESATCQVFDPDQPKYNRPPCPECGQALEPAPGDSPGKLTCQTEALRVRCASCRRAGHVRHVRRLLVDADVHIDQIRVTLKRSEGGAIDARHAAENARRLADTVEEIAKVLARRAR